MLLLVACAPDAPASPETEDPGPIEPLFSFVVFADPHVTGEGEHADRLRAAVAWVNAEAAARSIEMVVIVGDIAWGDGVTLAYDLLGELTVPWVPVLGDNEVQLGSEEAFDTTFAPQYGVLAETFEGFGRATTPVDNPEIGASSWFQDFSFEHRGVHVVGLDWCTRFSGGIVGETADLHRFAGGTWGWFEADLAGLGEGPDERVLLFSHHPMHLGMFDLDELDSLDALLLTWDAELYANFAGHYHVTGEDVDTGRPIDVYVTDATWDDTNTVRLVAVSGNAATMQYEHEIVEVD